MMRPNRLFTALAMVGAVVMSAMSQTPTDSVQSLYPEKFKVAPVGRMLIDGALYFKNRDGFSDGAAFPDTRLGLQATYGRWTARIVAGYAFGKVMLRDASIRYDINPNQNLKIGYFINSFGLETATAGHMKPTMELLVPDRFFQGLVANIGVQYTYHDPKFFIGAGPIIGNDDVASSAENLGKVSAGVLDRFVWHPIAGNGKVVQVGISSGYQTAHHKAEKDENGETRPSSGFFNFSSTFPTYASRVDMLQADVTNARYLIKLSPELLLAKGRLALEGQYYYMNVVRRNLPSYQAQGCYATLRGIVLGKDYGYNSATAALATPAPKSLELTAGFSYTDAHCAKAGIYGGIARDYSLTASYYINKYFIARLHYAFASVRGSDVQRDRNINILEARIQIGF
ncbi:MAG: hypothetical protein HDS79_07965 [Bacteroidales bacterium]|nr:hypothetical protein [Bacteroidales bacterium]